MAETRDNGYVNDKLLKRERVPSRTSALPTLIFEIDCGSIKGARISVRA